MSRLSESLGSSLCDTAISAPTPTQHVEKRPALHPAKPCSTSDQGRPQMAVCRMLDGQGKCSWSVVWSLSSICAHLLAGLGEIPATESQGIYALRGFHSHKTHRSIDVSLRRNIWLQPEWPMWTRCRRMPLLLHYRCRSSGELISLFSSLRISRRRRRLLIRGVLSSSPKRRLERQRVAADLAIRLQIHLKGYK